MKLILLCIQLILAHASPNLNKHFYNLKHSFLKSNNRFNTGLRERPAACSSDTSCTAQMYSNNICDEECANVECEWDGNDCEGYKLGCNATQCPHNNFWDGTCHQGCNTAECFWDGFDCHYPFQSAVEFSEKIKPKYSDIPQVSESTLRFAAFSFLSNTIYYMNPEGNYTEMVNHTETVNLWEKYETEIVTENYKQICKDYNMSHVHDYSFIFAGNAAFGAAKDILYTNNPNMLVNVGTLGLEPGILCLSSPFDFCNMVSDYYINIDYFRNVAEMRKGLRTLPSIIVMYTVINTQQRLMCIPDFYSLTTDKIKERYNVLTKC